MQLLPVPINEAESTLPQFNSSDESKRRYLSFRVCGFSRKESRKYAGIEDTTVRNWCKTDLEFSDIERKNLPELRQQYSKEFVKLDFIHNFKLAMEKDRQVLEKATGTDKRKVLTKEEWAYLRAIRGLYTPQQLNTLEGLSQQFNTSTWDEVLLIARKNVQIQESPDQETGGPAEYQEGTVIEGRIERET